LDGIVVVDGGTAITCPLAASMLADMGATCIKIEGPHGIGDINRPIGPTRNGLGVYFHNFNRGKEGVVLDLKKAEGVTALKRVVAKADVFIQNFRCVGARCHAPSRTHINDTYRPGVTDRMGIGYEDLKSVNPDLIYVSISGFGQTGPYSGRMGFDAVLQPMTGCASAITISPACHELHHTSSLSRHYHTTSV
jgi:crotonobetainyl-CoA:carnitine CoA-transferase CaiB-like acyl-CoA transferase